MQNLWLKRVTVTRGLTGTSMLVFRDSTGQKEASEAPSPACNLFGFVEWDFCTSWSI